MRKLTQPFPFLSSLRKTVILRGSVLILAGLLFCISCKKEETDSILCEGDYFYYSGGSKINLRYYSSDEVWIEFVQRDVTKEYAKTILEKYSFVNSELPIIGNNNYRSVIVRINYKAECEDFKTYLKILNTDIEILSATPVFYLSENDPDSYWILLGEVLTKNNEEVISESDFIEYAETFNLKLIGSQYSTQRFKVKELYTGFEALEIANKIYESSKVHYSHPNFIAKVVTF